MRRLALTPPLLLLIAMATGCGSSGSPGSPATNSTVSAATDFNRMRDKVILGLATDFRGGTHAGPSGYGLCVRLGMRRALTRLVSVYCRPGGQQFAAQALNALAAPIGAECGGAKFVPELVGASEALGGAYPLSRLDIAARRLGIGYGPYLGVRCGRAGSTGCDAVGIDVVLHREAAAVTAWVGGRRVRFGAGRRVRLRTPGLHNGVAGRDWVGYLGRAGFGRPESPGLLGREPLAAIGRMRPGDALISIQEYTVTAAMRSRIGTAGRPPSLHESVAALSLRRQSRLADKRSSDSALLWSSTLPFTDHGRWFAALVYLRGRTFAGQAAPGPLGPRELRFG